jgi:hypothetical protein
VLQPDDPELNQINLASEFGTSAPVLIRRGNDDVILLLALSYECFDSRKSELGRAAENVIATVVFSQIFDEFITGKSTIKEEYAIGRNMRQKDLSIVALGIVDRAYHPGHRQLSKHVVSGHHKALGIMPLAAIIKAAFGIEFGTEFVGRRKTIFGAINGVYGHLVP